RCALGDPVTYDGGVWPRLPEATQLLAQSPVKSGDSTIGPRWGVGVHAEAKNRNTGFLCSLAGLRPFFAFRASPLASSQRGQPLRRRPAAADRLTHPLPRIPAPPRNRSASASPRG